MHALNFPSHSSLGNFLQLKKPLLGGRPLRAGAVSPFEHRSRSPALRALRQPPGVSRSAGPCRRAPGGAAAAGTARSASQPGTRGPPGGRQAARSSRERVKGRWRGRPAAGSEHVQSAAASAPRASGAAALRLPPPAAGRPWSPVRRWGRGAGGMEPRHLPGCLAGSAPRPPRGPEPGDAPPGAEGGGCSRRFRFAGGGNETKGGRRGPGLREGAATPGAPPPRLASPQGAPGSGEVLEAERLLPGSCPLHRAEGFPKRLCCSDFSPSFHPGKGKITVGQGWGLGAGWHPRRGLSAALGGHRPGYQPQLKARESSSFFNLSRCQGGCSCSVFGTENAFRMAEFLQDGKPESFRPSFAPGFHKLSLGFLAPGMRCQVACPSSQGELSPYARAS